MICLSQTSAYAVHALSCLSDSRSKTCLVRDIAETAGIPKPYLAKIVNSLQHHGLVYAKRGYRGGIALARPPERITVLQVVKAMEGEKWIGECLMGLEDCSARKICPTHKAWTKVRRQIEGLLRSTTLADTLPFSKLTGGHANGRRGRRSNSGGCCQKEKA